MKIITFIFTIFLIPYLALGQNIGIGTLNPDESAKLEIYAEDKGLLIPRMDSTQRKSIPSPAVGLLVYDLDYKAICHYSGVRWICHSMLIQSENLNGINCWDLNGNGENDSDEDINGDGIYNAFDCQSSTGTDGINCWDLNGNGQNDSDEDINGDGNYDSKDCQGDNSNLGQEAFTIYGNEEILINNATINNWISIPGVRLSIDSDGKSLFLINGEGGVQVNTDSEGASYTDVGIFIDGNLADTFRRIPSINSKSIYSVAAFSITFTRVLSAGDHIIEIRAKKYNEGFFDTIIGSGNSGSSLPGNPPLQCKLSVIKFKQ